jgi:hypothetical protein
MFHLEQRLAMEGLNRESLQWSSYGKQTKFKKNIVKSRILLNRKLLNQGLPAYKKLVTMGS